MLLGTEANDNSSRECLEINFSVSKFSTFFEHFSLFLDDFQVQYFDVLDAFLVWGFLCSYWDMLF